MNIEDTLKQRRDWLKTIISATKTSLYSNDTLEARNLKLKQLYLAQGELNGILSTLTLIEQENENEN